MSELLGLLGKHLKDDEVIDVLESYDLEVIYDFDRLHENTPDVYWVHARKVGFCLQANADQRIETIFCYLQPAEGYDTLSADPGFPLPGTPEEALATLGAPSKSGQGWRRYDSSAHSVHYTWSNSRLSLACLMLSDAAPT